ncbi:MAG: histidine kinase [Kiritimatiellia bacterium]|jgi:signal transduction histidine kinase|nr:histidine kinase [Kiritimatiellia bacterium]
MARGQVVLAALVLGLGLGATAWMAVSQHRQEQARIEREFQQAADKLFGRTLRDIQLFMEVLDSIRQLHSLSDQVTPEAFNEIVRKGMIYQRRILGAYGFAQSIPHDMREAYEGVPSKRSIVHADGRGGFVAVEARPLYYPLTYQTPPGGLGIPEGYDFMARQEDRDAIDAMRRWGVFALGGQLVGQPVRSPDTRERYMFAPILYQAGPGVQELAGFAIGLFQPDQILARARGDEARGVRARVKPSGLAQHEEDHAWTFVRTFSLANEEWQFVAEADPIYWAGERSRAPEGIALTGGGLSLALAGALLLLAGRSRRIEILVQNRTAELAEANRRLKALMEERRELEDEVLRISGHEKARMGRDLHDSLGQKLTGTMFLFKAFRQRVDTGTTPEAEQIAATLRDAISQVRRIARGLAPVTLTEEGLPDALRRLAEETTAVFQKKVEFYSEREGRPRDAATAEHLYLIAQEALHNALKHGEPTHVVLTLDYDERSGILTIEDDGRGMAQPKPDDREGGSGLRIMRHRAEVFGGAVEVGPSPQGGVRVSCRFPSAST